MLLTAAVCSAEGNYLTANENDQERLYGQIFITDGQMPAVMLSSAYAGGILSHDPYYEREYVIFPCPPSAKAMGFDTFTATFYSEETGYAYQYTVEKEEAYETFVAKANTNEDCIVIADGTAGWAAYVECSKYSQRAFAMIAIKEMGEAAKLLVKLDYAGRGVKEEASLITEITAEVNRLLENLSFVKDVPFWTEGAFDGFTMRSTESYGPNVSMTYTFPLVSFGDNESREFVTSMNRYEVDTMLRFPNASMTLEYSLDTYSPVESRKESDPQSVQTVHLADGYVYDIWYSPSYDDRINYVYVSRVLTDKAGYDGDDNLYLSIRLDGDELYWTSLEDLISALNVIVSSMTWDAPFEFLQGEVPAATEAPTPETTPVPEATAAPAAGWTCPGCDQENEGNFCSNCGTQKPAGPWFCPNCGQKNEGNFCSNCGTKKP